MKNDKYFQLFSNCLLVNGNKGSIICDLHRGSYFNISNKIYELLEYNQKDPIPVNNSINIDKFYTKLIEKGLGFFTSKPEIYPSLAMKWDSPYQILSCIFEIDNFKKYDVNGIFRDIEKIGTYSVTFFILSSFTESNITDLLLLINKSKIRNVELIFEVDYLINGSFLKNILINNRISRVEIFSSSKNVTDFSFDERFNIFFYNISLRKILYGTKFKNAFIVNTDSFTEAKSFNLALNRMICINKNGEIKNHLSFEESFGNVNTSNLLDILNSVEFQRKWLINNDMIDVCKDCQYRYICYDLSDINGFKKLNKCNFSPYE